MAPFGLDCAGAGLSASAGPVGAGAGLGAGGPVGGAVGGGLGGMSQAVAIPVGGRGCFGQAGLVA